MKSSITTLGGVIQQSTGHYLAATFQSKFFRFIDDVEVRVDQSTAQTTIHLRSASRVGYSDFEVNRKRMENLRRQFQQAQAKSAQ